MRIISGKRRVAEQRQPMRLRRSRQQFGWAFPGPRCRVFARRNRRSSRKLQQCQVVRPQVPTQKEISSRKPAVEVLDHTAGTHHLAQQRRHGGLRRRRSVSPSVATTPAPAANAPGGSPTSSSPGELRRPPSRAPRSPRPASGDPGRVAGEGHQFVAVVFQQAERRANAVAGAAFPRIQFPTTIQSYKPRRPA